MKFKVGKSYRTIGGWRAVVLSYEERIITQCNYDEMSQLFIPPLIEDHYFTKMDVLHEINGRMGTVLNPMAVSLGNFNAEHSNCGRVNRDGVDKKLVFDHPCDLTEEEWREDHVETD